MSRHHDRQKSASRRALVRRLGLGCAMAVGLAGCAAGRELTVQTVQAIGNVGTGLWRALGGSHDRKDDASLDDDAFVRDIDRRCRKATQLLDSGDAAGAAEVLEEAIAAHPDEIDARLQLARVLQGLRRLDEADEEASAVLAAAPQNVEALLLRAEIAAVDGRPDKALERYHRVLAASPGNVPAQLRIAQLEMAAAHPERAAPLLRSVCQSTQTSPEQRADAMWTLGLAYGLERRWSDAAAALAAAAPHRPRMTADDWYQLAYARNLAGDAEGAASDLQQALQREPGHRGAAAMQQELRRAMR